MLFLSSSTLQWITQPFISVLFVAANCVMCRQPQQPNECPHAYWDGPSKRCSDSLHQVLEEIRTSDKLISAEAEELNHNKTCKEWDRTNACYQQLIQRCNGDAAALHELSIHIGRYVIYSHSCRDPSRRDRKYMVDCFLPDIKSTRMCTEAIDKHLRKFVVDKDYRAACRVISIAMKCFQDIKNNIRQRCSDDGAKEYEQNYILPLVDQTRETVLEHCAAWFPDLDYYLNSSPPSATSISSQYVACHAITITILLLLLRAPLAATCAFTNLFFTVRSLLLWSSSSSSSSLQKSRID